jgi:proton-dependent oligopeptide transporter, POT family
LPGHVEHVWGYTAIRSGLEFFTGPLGVQPLSSMIYGLYTGFVYLTPIFGGLLADKVLGQRKTVIIGALLMALGHFMMAFERLLFPALLMLILGNGAFKPNISTQVGGLYAPGDHRRDRAFSIFYVGINVGAFFSPLVCGTLGEEVGWHYGFGAAGVGMLIALTTYLIGYQHLPVDELTIEHEKHMDTRPLNRDEWKAVSAILILFVPTTLFWATYEQQGNTIALWADMYTDRSVNLLFWSGEIPVTWFQAFNPFMIFAFTPFVISLWTRQAKRGTEPSTVRKMAMGCFGCGTAYLIMATAAFFAGDGGQVSWLWLFFYFVTITMGELYLSPIGLSLVSRVSPIQVVSLMMGFWLATSFIGNLLAGWLGSFWSSMGKESFFLMIASVVGCAGLVIWFMDRFLKPILKE